VYESRKTCCCHDTHTLCNLTHYEGAPERKFLIPVESGRTDTSCRHAVQHSVKLYCLQSHAVSEDNSAVSWPIEYCVAISQGCELTTHLRPDSRALIEGTLSACNNAISMAMARAGRQQDFQHKLQQRCAKSSAISK
jgi:hypothetical protein